METQKERDLAQFELLREPWRKILPRLPYTLDGNCKCGLTYAACKYPVSHNHPTVDNIELNDGADSVRPLRRRKTEADKSTYGRKN